MKLALSVHKKVYPAKCVVLKQGQNAEHVVFVEAGEVKYVSYMN